MSAPVIEWIRDGVGFTPPAAASFRRAEESWGRQIDSNSTYRDYDLQLRMYLAWLLFSRGLGPYPGHSRAIHPDESVHCEGEALDTDDWATPGFIAHMADHGWIRTAAADPTERHHFEYQWWRDAHRNETAGSGSSTTFPTEEDDMFGQTDRDTANETNTMLKGQTAIRTRVIRNVVTGDCVELRPTGRRFLNAENGEASGAGYTAGQPLNAAGTYWIDVPADRFQWELERHDALVDEMDEHIRALTGAPKRQPVQ